MNVRRLSFDVANGRAVVELEDGRLVIAPVSNPPDPESTNVRRTTIDLATDEMTLEFADGRAVIADLLDQPAAVEYVRSRPIVYLDQLHWIALAKQLHTPEKVLKRDRAAALQLIELARQRRIVLPLSSAHFAEAGPLWGRRRSELILTMLELSRGWFMRSPVVVRQRELHASMSQHARDPNVFGLEPDALFVERLGFDAPADLPPRLAWLHRRGLELMCVYDAALDDEPVDPEPGRRAASGWAASHAELADHLRGRAVERDITALVAHGRLLSDLQTEIADVARAAGFDQLRLDHWLIGAQAAIAKLPFLARSQQLLYQRLRDGNNRWHGNDLVDMHYLACAAAYADVVVGERKTSDHLIKLGRRVPPGAVVCSTLPASADAIDGLLDATDVGPAAAR